MKMWPPPNAPSPSAEWRGTAPLVTEQSPRHGPASGQPQSPLSPLPDGAPGSLGTRLFSTHPHGLGNAFSSGAGTLFVSPC